MEQIQPLLIDLVAAVIIAVGGFVIAFIKQKTKDLKARTNNDITDKYIDLAFEAITTSVLSVQQTYVHELKKAGKFTKKLQTEAFNMAKNKALKIMDDSVKETINYVFGDIEEWIESKIEENIYIIK